MTQYSNPIATLYIYQYRGRPVAIGLGQAPPDPGDVVWDSLLRIPIVRNGSRPPWRAWTCRQNESIRVAMRRRKWPAARN